MRKVKVLKAPKFDQQKLMEVHENYEDTGAQIARPEGEEGGEATTQPAAE